MLLSPPVPEKQALAAFERFRGRVVRRMRTRRITAAMVRVKGKGPDEHHWSYQCWRA